MFAVVVSNSSRRLYLSSKESHHRVLREDFISRSIVFCIKATSLIFSTKNWIWLNNRCFFTSVVYVWSLGTWFPSTALKEYLRKSQFEKFSPKLILESCYFSPNEFPEICLWVFLCQTFTASHSALKSISLYHIFMSHFRLRRFKFLRSVRCCNSPSNF